MNILYYCEEYPPVRNGGIGTVVKLVAEAMCKRGHKVVVAGKYWEGRGIRTIEHINGVEIIRWHKRSYNLFAIHLFSFFCPLKAKELIAQMVFTKTQNLIKQVVNQYAIDIVEIPDYVDDFIHFNHLRTPVWNCSVPRIIRVHGSVSFLFHYLKGCPDETRIVQDKAFISQSDAICAVSSFSKSYVERYLCVEKEVKVIYNPIEEHWFRQDLVKESSETILFFGKIAEMKGVFSLVKAFNLLANDYPQIKLKIIGNGDTEPVKKLVEPQFIDRVVFEGFLPQDQIMEEIDHSLFCVLPSYFENFSMAALEVLARKKALVYTCRTSGSELIEDGQNGLLVDPDDIMQLSLKMRLLLSDPELCDRLAENGYNMCLRRFSTDAIIPQMESYYKEVKERCKE